MSKKRILVTGYSLGIGGMSKALLGLVNSFDYNIYDVDLLLMKQEGDFLEYVNNEVTILPTPSFFNWILYPKGRILKCCIYLWSHPFILFYYLKNLIWGLVHHSMRKARQHIWDDLISYLPSLPGCYEEVYDFSGELRCYTSSKVKSKKKYTWVHSDYRVYGLSKTIDGRLLRNFDAIYCVSETCKKIFDDQYPSLASKCEVRQNIIDVNFIRDHLSGPSFDDNFDGVRLLDVTRIDPNKGLDLAVLVCKELKDRNLNFRWYILGNDPLGYQVELEKLIKKYGVEDCFILAGSTKNPFPYMDQADIIVHFSRFEGRSVSIDEALALNKTILLTNYETAKDQITNGVNGYICNFDVYELANTLEKLINNHAK